MFKSRKKSQITVEEISSSTIVGRGTLLSGSIRTSGNIRVEGKLIGEIESQAKVVVGESAKIEGNIFSLNSEIAGEVKGNLEITGCLVLKPTAVIHGDILAYELQIEPGATFNGSCDMKKGKEVAITNNENIDSDPESAIKLAS